MKKYLFILISSSFLFSSEGAKAAENRDVVKIAATMTAKPHWADFMADPTYDAVKGNMSLRGPHAIREALEAAYDAWRPGYLGGAGGAAHVGGAIAAVAGGVAPTATAIAADATLKQELARNHHAALVTALGVHNTAGAATAIAGNADLTRRLITGHADALVQEGSMTLIQEGSMALMEHAPLQPHLRHIVLSHATSHAATAAAIAGDAALRGEVINSIAAGHHGDMIAKLAADGRHADMRTAVIGHAASHADTAAAIVANDALRNAVIAALEAGRHAVGAAKVSTIVRGADPAANAPYGDGRWHDVFSNWGGGRGNNDGGKTAVRELIVALDVGITNAELAD